MNTELTAHERAGKVTLELIANRKITNARARELTGLTRHGTLYLLNSISRQVLPLIYERRDQTWYVFGGLVELRIPMIR
jgi:hypothetical protein